MKLVHKKTNKTIEASRFFINDYSDGGTVSLETLLDNIASDYHIGFTSGEFPAPADKDRELLMEFKEFLISMYQGTLIPHYDNKVDIFLNQKYKQ